MNSAQNHNVTTNTTSVANDNGSKPGSKTSGGPKTPAGKRRVRLNSRKHGFFSQELAVSEEDRAEFETMKKGIRSSLRSASFLQQLAVDDVVTNCWRRMLAYRMERRRLMPYFHSSDLHTLEEAPTETAYWYTAGPQGLRRAAKFLGDLKADVQASGGAHLEEQKDSIVKIFGNDFYKSLTEWGPINTSGVLLSESMQYHAEKFNMLLPSSLVLPEDVMLASGRMRWEMMVKVVDWKLQEVTEVDRLLAQANGEAESPQSVALDVVNRYVTSAGRELERAVEWYRKLVEAGL